MDDQNNSIINMKKKKNSISKISKISKIKKFQNVVEEDIQQTMAIIFKDMTLQFRQWKSNLCLFISPIIFMIFLYILQIIIDRAVIPRLSEQVAIETVIPAVPLNLLMIQFLLMIQKGMNKIPKEIIYSDGGENDEWRKMIPDLYFANLYQVNSSDEVDNVMYKDLERMADDKDGEYTFPYYGGIKINDVGERILDYVAQYEGGSGLNLASLGGGGGNVLGGFSLGGGGGGGGGRLSGNTQLCSSILSGGVVSTLVSAVLSGQCEYVIQSFLMDLLHFTYVKNKTKFGIHTLVAQLPYLFTTKNLVIDILPFLGTIVYALIILLPLPHLMYSLVKERENSTKEMMKLMGMKERNYLCSTFTFKLVIYLFTMMILLIMGLILKHRFFVQSGFFLLVLTVIGVGCLIVSLSFFLSSFIHSTFVGTLLAYIFVVFSPIVGSFVNQLVLQQGRISMKFLLLFPPFPITECILYLMNACNAFSCLKMNNFLYNSDFVFALVMTYVDAIIYLLLSLYLEQITPREWGIKKNPCFCFKSCFMMICRRNSVDEEVTIDEKSIENEDDDVKEMRNKISKNELTSDEDGIVVKNLVKKFGKHTAVDSLFFHVGKRELFGLLGTNGAGKTTTIRIISGLYPLTSGKVSINGISIKEDMRRIRKSLGLCPQFTVYFPTLTPTEHLLFYTRLKGSIPIKKHKEKVEELLKKIGLKVKRKKKINFVKKIWYFLFPNERRSAQLSGGMLRRLAIGIGLCGEPEIVLFDEPTTGLDPLNKRYIWDVILAEKKNRCIILTTHSMEEADVLSDRIGIMKNGKLLCCGNSLHLKKKYGNGYIVKNTFNTPEDAEMVDTKFIDLFKEFAKVILLKKSPFTKTFQLIAKDIQKSIMVSKIFSIIEENKISLKIKEFEVNQTSLNDVFLNVIRSDKKNDIDSKSSTGSDVLNVHDVSMKKLEEKDINDVDIVEIEENIDSKTVEKKEKVDSESQKKDDNDEKTEKEEEEDKEIDEEKLPSTIQSLKTYFSDTMLQIIFLLYKNFLINIRAWKTSCLQIFSPFIVVMVLFILTLLVLLTQNDPVLHPPIQQIDTSNIIKCTSWGNKHCYTLVYSVNTNEFAKTIMNDVTSSYNLVEFDDYLEFNTTREMESYILNNPNTTLNAVSFLNIFNVTQLNVNLTQLLDLGITLDLSFLNLTIKVPINVTQIQDFLFLLTGSPIFNRNITVANVTNILGVEKLILYTLYFNSSGATNQFMEIKTIIDNRINYYSQKYRGIDVSELDKNAITVSRQPFPKIRSRVAVNGQQLILSTSGPLFFSLSSLILFVMSLYRLVVEKEKGLKDGLKMIGMKKVSYLVSWFITFFLFAVLMTITAIIAGYIFAIDVFVYSNPVFTFVMFICFDLSLIFAAFLTSVFFSSAKEALTFGFIILGISFILNLFLANGVLAYMLFNLTGGWKVLTLMFEIFYSPFSFAKIFQDIINKTVKIYDPITNTYKANVKYFKFSDVFSKNSFSVPQFGVNLYSPASIRSLLFLLLNSVILLIIFLLFENYLKKNIIEIIKSRYKQFVNTCCVKGKKKLVIVDSKLAAKDEKEIENMDEDVKDEYNNVRDSSKKAILRLANLKKSYRNLFGKKVDALKGIDLVAEKGTIVAMLGHNGAGKSTTINQIAGIIEKGSGEILVDGFSTTYYQSMIRKRLGICLQHDLFWPTLTPKDHILLFSQMKGFTKLKNVRKVTEEKLKEVSLYDVRNKQTKKFSGGMKRRLSVVLAFLRDPKLILLDEPTTGLDPYSRSQVWKVIKKTNTSSCSLLLTTHSMEEAEILAQKVTILQQGKMLCVGDTLKLKTKYGAGYVLKFIIIPNKSKEFEEMMIKYFPHAKLVTGNAGNYIYNILHIHQKEMVNGMQKIEEEIESGHSCCVKEFGLSNTTLEDVYLRVTKHEFEKEEKKDSENE